LNAALGWRLPSWLLDYGPVAFIVLVGGVATATANPRVGGVSVAFVWLALAVEAAALLFRHRAPLVVLAIVLACALALDYGPVVMLPTLLALFTVAECRDRLTVLGAALVTAAVLIAAQPIHANPEAWPAALSHLVAVGLAVALGLFLRARADYVGGLQERAARLERERELLAHQAAGEERVRIARELHDVVAHNVSLMVVQAQALAATHGDEDPERQAALGRLASLGREALSEMHRMLGVLRLDGGEDAEREPQPGVRDLDRLIARSVQTGLEAKLVVKGEPRTLPPAVDLSAYRIVQEALTNVIRHSRAQHVDVKLEYAQDHLLVTVVDDGVGPSAQSTNGSSGGHGLVGMRERVALFGGELDAGARGDRQGYRIHASLPTR
jgi:signal transduction histidine kinase